MKLPHEPGSVGLPCTDGSVLYFGRTGNGVWQATRGEFFATVRVPHELRTQPPHLHFFDELSVEKVDAAADYLGAKIDWPAISPTKYVVLQGDGDIRRVISNGVIGDGFRMSFDSFSAARRALDNFQAHCGREAGRAVRLTLAVMPSPDAEHFGVDVALARVVEENGSLQAVLAN